MTKEDFLAFYPQFSAVPTIVLDTYLESANQQFDLFLDDAEEARRLYIAHKLTLYSQTASPEGAGMAQLKKAGSSLQATSKNVGGVSIGLSEGSAVSSITGWNEWKLTSFGVQLITLAKRVTAGGVYIP